jgi:hypothetical protein
MRIGTRLISWIGERQENEKMVVNLVHLETPSCPKVTRSLDRISKLCSCSGKQKDSKIKTSLRVAKNDGNS